jgi:hypothetical protein
MMDFMDHVIAGIKERDHKRFMVPTDHEISDAIFDQMDAEGYIFACAKAADKKGMCEVYFVADPALEPRYSI